MAADSVKQGFALPRDKYGTPVPVMTPDVANIVTASLTTSSTAEAQVHNGTSNFVYRVWSIGCAAYVRFGATGMAAASSSAGFYVPDGSPIDVNVPKASNFVRAIAVSGSGTLRLERLV